MTWPFCDCGCRLASRSICRTFSAVIFGVVAQIWTRYWYFGGNDSERQRIVRLLLSRLILVASICYSRPFIRARNFDIVLN